MGMNRKSFIMLAAGAAGISALGSWKAAFAAGTKNESVGRAWMKDVPEAVYEPAHIILSVPPGGESYSLSFLDARDENMTVKSEVKLWPDRLRRDVANKPVWDFAREERTFFQA